METKTQETSLFQHEVDRIVESFEQFSEAEVCPTYRKIIKKYGNLFFEEKRQDLYHKMRSKFESNEDLSLKLDSALDSVPEYDRLGSLHRMEQVLLFAKQEPDLLENIDLLNEIPLLYRGFEIMIQEKSKLIKDNTYRISLDDDPQTVIENIERNMQLFNDIYQNLIASNPELEASNRPIEIARPFDLISIHLLLTSSGHSSKLKAIDLHIAPSQEEQKDFLMGFYFTPFRLVLHEDGLVEQSGYGNPDRGHARQFLYTGYRLITENSFPNFYTWPIDELVFLKQLAGINGVSFLEKNKNGDGPFSQLLENDPQFSEFTLKMMEKY